MSAEQGRGHLAFALDVPTWGEASPIASVLAPHVGVLKLGLELFCREGPSAVRSAVQLGLDVFLDLKLHDIPETVERAVASLGSLGVRYLTIHASGGRAMIERASRRAESSGIKVLAVTVLTSLDDADIGAIGYSGDSTSAAARLAKLAIDAGAHGLVCSAAEVDKVRAAAGPNAILVTPGIRPAGASVGDQKRVATPRDAIARGADLLVVGRPLRDASDPIAVASEIVRDIELGLRDRVAS